MRNTDTNLTPRAIVVEPRRHPRSGTIQRWAPLDDVAAQADAVGRVLCARRYPLSQPLTVRGPGAYVLEFRGKHEDFLELHAGIVYCGMSIGDIGERLSSHHSSIKNNPDLDVSDFQIAALPCAAAHFAKMAEDLLIGAFDPPWCRPGLRGFGSRPQGRRRPQLRTAYDEAYPGRFDRV